MLKRLVSFPCCCCIGRLAQRTSRCLTTPLSSDAGNSIEIHIEGMLQALSAFLPEVSPTRQGSSQVPLGLKDAEEVGRDL